MPWSSPRRTGEPPTADEVIRRLAYHIYRRTADPQLEQLVRLKANVCSKTLRRYRAYQRESLRIDSNNGPRRLDIYYSICLAMGENPGLVLWAATASSDYDGMLALMASEVQLHHRVTVIDAGGQTSEGCATVRVQSAASSRGEFGVEPSLSPAA